MDSKVPKNQPIQRDSRGGRGGYGREERGFRNSTRDGSGHFFE